MTSASPPVIPLTARAAVLRAWGTPYVIDPSFPVPQPGSLKRGECLIKLEYSGVCHSDLHIMKDEWGRSPALPLVGGHEGIGVVVAVGGDADLEQEEVKVGDRVGIKWIAGTCLRWVIILCLSFTAVVVVVPFFFFFCAEWFPNETTGSFSSVLNAGQA